MVEGITIDAKTLKQNPFFGMTLSLILGVNREFNSNLIDESDLHFEPNF
jgi:hypothetical protein